MNLNHFSQLSDIDIAIHQSKDKLQIFFKHSTQCPISRMAFEKFQKEYPLLDTQADVHYIGVIEERSFSNYLAEKLQVKHESPQMIVVKNEIAVYDESHLMINPSVLSQFI